MNGIARSASTLESLMEVSAEIAKQWGFDKADLGQPWYRGQQRKHWRLTPTIFRLGCLDREAEDNIREEFVLRAPALAASQAMPGDDWDFYFLMQHFGAPTRLIDWTENILIALYFALRDNPGYYDSAIWMLEPYKLNEKVLNKREILAPSAPGANPKERVLVKNWLPTRWKSAIIPDYPVALHPTHIAARISSQKSCFTIHGKRDDGFNRFWTSKPSTSCLAKIIIPSVSVSDFKLSLQRFGVDETTIFPDLQGLGKSLATSYAVIPQEKAHRNIFIRLGISKLKNADIGVFAIRDIPKGKTIFAGENEEILWTNRDRLPSSRALRKLYDDFSIIRDGQYGTPPSFNRLTPAWYMNDSKKPNTKCSDNYDFVALRDIRAGEELTVDCSTFSELP